MYRKRWRLSTLDAISPFLLRRNNRHPPIEQTISKGPNADRGIYIETPTTTTTTRPSNTFEGGRQSKESEKGRLEIVSGSSFILQQTASPLQKKSS